MKKTLIIFLFLAFGLAWRSWAVTQAQNLGIISASVKSLTAAQVLLSTSTAVGELIYCSNCAANGAVGTLCISTATAKNSFVLSTGTVCR
jgi:hypothetical protein